MNLQSEFGYCMATQTYVLHFCKREGITDKRMYDPITRCPRRTFQAGGIKSATTPNSFVEENFSEKIDLHLACGISGV